MTQFVNWENYASPIGNNEQMHEAFAVIQDNFWAGFHKPAITACCLLIHRHFWFVMEKERNKLNSQYHNRKQPLTSADWDIINRIKGAIEQFQSDAALDVRINVVKNALVSRSDFPDWMLERLQDWWSPKL